MRIERLAKYLPDFEWQPIVMTPALVENPDRQLTIIETPYRDVLGFWRRLFKISPQADVRSEIKRRFNFGIKYTFIDFFLTRIGEVVNYPDVDKHWRPFAIKAGEELLQKENMDAIISSSSPVTGHLVAMELSQMYKIPWIADLRDLWSQNHHYRYSPLRRCADRRLELRTLSKADALITVSEPWAEKLRGLHRGKDVYTITHGFNPEEVNVPPAGLTKNFTITYTGTIYPAGQDTSKIFTALQTLISSGEIDRADIEVRFYGRYYSWLTKEIEKYGLTSIARQYGPLPRLEAVAKQRESHLLLVLDWEDPREKGVYGGKIFEYLAAMRPILVTGGSEDGVINTLLKETRAGVHAATVKDVETALRQFYHEYKQQGRVTHRVDEASLGKYSHREMARQFSEILDGLT
jgi:glycosyltransferase involved in cell wall biosynthesis